MAKKRRKNGRVNPVREWISDNLRYLLLILVVVIAALVAFLVYRGFSNRSQSGATTTAINTTASSGNVTTTTVSSSTAAASESKTDIVTATPTPTATPTATPTPTPTPAPTVKLEENNSEVLSAAQNYFYGLQVGGQSEVIEYYDNIQVYSTPGPEEDTYVVYAVYDYKFWNYDSIIPGVTELYLERGEDGFLQNVDVVPAEVEDFIKTDVQSSEEVQALIRPVQEKYDEILAADPALAAYLTEGE